MRNVLILAVIAASLSGCIVSRVDPQKPELPLPAVLPEQAQAATALPEPWWTIFNDPQLNQLIDEALLHNPDIAIAAARVMQARAVLGITSADRWPAIGVQGDATRSSDSLYVNTTPGIQRERTIYTVQGGASFEIDLWGKFMRASQSAQEQLLSSEFGREATKLSLTGEVARSYFGLIAQAQAAGSRPRHTCDARGVAEYREAALRCRRERRVHVQAR